MKKCHSTENGRKAVEEDIVPVVVVVVVVASDRIDRSSRKEEEEERMKNKTVTADETDEESMWSDNTEKRRALIETDLSEAGCTRRWDNLLTSARLFFFFFRLI